MQVFQTEKREREREKFGIFLLYNYDAEGNLEYL